MTTVPTPDQIDTAARLLHDLAAPYGLTRLHHGDEPGEIVADVEPGRTYMDIARFELDIEDRFGWAINVTSARAPRARAGPAITSH